MKALEPLVQTLQICGGLSVHENSKKTLWIKYGNLTNVRAS